MEKVITIKKNIVFGQTDKELLTADVYMPKEGNDLPAVILIHGGAFQSGSKEMYQDWGRYLAESGFVAMAINYRLATEKYSIWPGVMNDIQAAVNWLVSKSSDWGIEPQRIGLIGDSAGAYLATQYSLQNPANASFNIRAVVNVYGVYDWEKEWENSRDMTQRYFGKSYSEAKEEFRIASPINLIESAVNNSVFDTSYFVIWGNTDKVAHPSHSEVLVENLEKNGIETKKLVIPNKGHFWFNIIPGLDGGTVQDYPNNEVAPLIIEFLNETLCTPVVGNFAMSRIQTLKTLL
ncbi:hypothetical protein HMPREF9372_3543 [Sporosarcina newyorkensis 2681]|uniref:BD-FAE-like domain-containing protein n=1 Tax=Sporosarcina newyorkensis 2681 TaxID=1027292 RepID=F9DXL2_9BACL|nr:alpha/beta hydrolase [Sporosarcina newyorkensis]EGQ20520.1 hypothetical protein HMPREF9372_3543 [Sporosarcina newyorkensis 2681]